MQTFVIKRQDRRPVLRAQLLDENDAPVDLTGASVRFLMTNKLGQAPVVNAPAAIVDPASGTLEYQWAAGDTDVPGCYVAEFEVTFPDGTKRTFPGDGYIYMEIRQDIG